MCVIYKSLEFVQLLIPQGENNAQIKQEKNT